MRKLACLLLLLLSACVCESRSVVCQWRRKLTPPVYGLWGEYKPGNWHAVSYNGGVYIDCWYDSSGKGHHLSQGTAVYMPQVATDTIGNYLLFNDGDLSLTGQPESDWSKGSAIGYIVPGRTAFVTYGAGYIKKLRIQPAVSNVVTHSHVQNISGVCTSGLSKATSITVSSSILADYANNPASYAEDMYGCSSIEISSGSTLALSGVRLWSYFDKMDNAAVVYNSVTGLSRMWADSNTNNAVYVSVQNTNFAGGYGNIMGLRALKIYNRAVTQTDQIIHGDWGR